MNGRKIPEKERLRLNLESMTYVLMKNYGWTIRDVNNMSLKELEQSVSWAIAMNQVESHSDKGEGVYLNYDNVPPLR
jgi:hypothetical protein|tara:strand:- start:2397 stop:2627 length:231 start_codon:yes stop_codon:yes gene_type:complete